MVIAVLWAGGVCAIEMWLPATIKEVKRVHYHVQAPGERSHIIVVEGGGTN